MENKDVDWLQQYTHAFAQANTDVELFEQLARAARDLGFDYCAYGMRWPLPLTKPKLFLMNNYSSEWQQRYADENYLMVDPTVAHGLNSNQPLVWSESLFADSPGMWEDAVSHGLKVGWAQSAFDAKGVVGMLTLARNGEVLSESELRANGLLMTWLAQAGQQGMARLLGPKNVPEPATPLTAREIEVLRWTADGKTSGEVAEIMSISERTVNFHINNSLEKLGAPNKTACVIKAAMLRLL